MKPLRKALLVITMVISAAVFMAITAGASNYDAQADSLKDLGLFLGTDKGYELDRTSTRAESAVMLVRLLGKEAEVKAGSYTHPFTDVPSWANKYVGYMYENGLTNGTTATTFGTQGSCSAQMFTAFVLRALGYSENNGDFTYAAAQDFAKSIGLTEGYDTAATFLRDDMAALAYSSLSQRVNDGSNCILLEKLVADNAVDAGAAEKYLDMIRIYQSYVTDCSKIPQDKNMKIRSEMSIAMTAGDMEVNITQASVSSIVCKDSDSILRMDNTMNNDGTITNNTYYYYDGWLYMDTESGKFKYWDPIDINALIEQTGMISADVEPIYWFNSLEKEDTSSGFSYQFEFSPAVMNDMMGSIISQLTVEPDSVDFQYNSISMTVNFDQSGNIKDFWINAGVTLNITLMGQTVAMEMTVQTTSVVLATGDSVIVTLPADLDKYVETAEIVS